jgi:hypothetical protein
MIFEAYRNNNNKHWGKEESLTFISDFIASLEAREKKRAIDAKLTKEEMLDFEKTFKVNTFLKN